MSSSRLKGTEPVVGAARVRLEGEKPVWFVGDNKIEPGAGSGIAAQIVELVCGSDSDSVSVPRDDVAAGVGRERAIPVDQTHTSVIVDERWVVKVVGAWGGADRSAAILERLRRAGSTAAPRFAGALEWQHPERGTGVLALVAEYVPDSDDGWTWAVDDTLTYLTGGGPLPEWPMRVGELTAEMHTALRMAAPISDDAKDPRTEGREHATAVFDKVFESIEGEVYSGEIPRSASRPQDDEAVPVVSLDDGAVPVVPQDEGGTSSVMLRETQYAESHAEFATRMLNRKAALAAAILNISSDSTVPLVIPHGDFHVGQLLRTRAGRYFVLDFDGDPQWSAVRRLRPDGAARDVAHMIVSIDLVAAVVQRRLGHADERAWAWGDAAKQQFLESYLEASEPGLLDVSALEGLIAEQLLIELSYAEHYLPVWRYAPDGVITRRYTPDFRTGHETDNITAEQRLATEQTEPKWNPPALPTT